MAENLIKPSRVIDERNKHILAHDTEELLVLEETQKLKKNRGREADMIEQVKLSFECCENKSLTVNQQHQSVKSPSWLNCPRPMLLLLLLE